MDTHIIESMRNRLAQEIEAGKAPILNRRTLAEIIKCFDELQAENERLNKLVSQWVDNHAKVNVKYVRLKAELASAKEENEKRRGSGDRI